MSVVTAVRRTYRLLKNYIEPCFKIASGIERLPYENYIAAMTRDGYATVHAYGIARLCMGKIDYRAAHRVAKVHPTENEREFRNRGIVTLSQRHRPQRSGGEIPGG